MVHYRHKRFWGVTPPLLGSALGGGLVAALWGDPWEEWVAVWPMALFVLALFGWYWFVVGRHINRRVEVADDGLWIDGEWQVGAADIIAVGLAQDYRVSSYLARLDDAGIDSPGLAYWMGKGAWVQRNWLRLVEAEGVGKVAVPRSRDLNRGSGWHGVLVVSKRSHGRGRGADYRKGWLIGTFRAPHLVEAIHRIAPEAQFIDDVRVAERPR